MVVIAITVILGAIGLTAYTNAQKIARDGKRQGDIQEVQKALEQYYALNQKYPGNSGDAGTYASVNSYFPSGAAPKDPSTSANYTYQACATANIYKYSLCSTSMESCTSAKCNSVGAPADGCSAFVAGTATAYCVSSLSN